MRLNLACPHLIALFRHAALEQARRNLFLFRIVLIETISFTHQQPADHGLLCALQFQKHGNPLKVRLRSAAARIAAAWFARR